jgi:hypothetical protein
MSSFYSENPGFHTFLYKELAAEPRGKRECASTYLSTLTRIDKNKTFLLIQGRLGHAVDMNQKFVSSAWPDPAQTPTHPRIKKGENIRNQFDDR